MPPKKYLPFLVLIFVLGGVILYVFNKKPVLQTDFYGQTIVTVTPSPPRSESEVKIGTNNIYSGKLIDITEQDLALEDVGSFSLNSGDIVILCTTQNLENSEVLDLNSVDNVDLSVSGDLDSYLEIGDFIIIKEDKGVHTIAVSVSRCLD